MIEKNEYIQVNFDGEIKKTQEIRKGMGCTYGRIGGGMSFKEKFIIIDSKSESLNVKGDSYGKRREI